MSILQNSNAISAGGYDINNSLRFRSSASAYLNRTFTTPTNNKIWTWSTWVKRGTLTSTQVLFATSGDELRYIADGGASGVVDSFQYNLSTGTYGFRTNATYRDVSAWYHIVVAVDTTQATAANRARIYINGVEASTDGTYGIVQNANTQINSAVAHNIARRTSGSLYFDGYQAETYFVDGQQLTPSSFGETDTTTGSWKPKAYTGTYGTNGFYLKFSDIATTSGSNAGLGKDFSGNTNYWTTNNISVTSGTTYDAMTDVPTNTSATVANYATLNPNLRQTGTGQAPTSANLKLTANTTGYSQVCCATIASPSGKFYWEVTVNGGVGTIGIADSNNSAFTSVVCSTSATTSDPNEYTWGWSVNLGSGNKKHNNVSTSYGSAASSGDVYMCAVDIDNSKVWWGKNGTWFASGSPTAGTNAAYTNVSGNIIPYLSPTDGSGYTNDINFGQRPFSYTPPTGFNRLNTYNLPDSTIKKGNLYMDATLYTGNGVSNTIVNQGQFKPDLVWLKNRNYGAGTNHVLVDSVRGASVGLASNLTNADFSTAGNFSSINSNGFTVTGTAHDYNFSTDTFVGWQWQAGQGSSSSNTSGSITSTVSKSTTAGFSVVTYTGNATDNASIGHGLGIKPSMIIVKSRSAAESWETWHTSLNNGGVGNQLRLNSTSAAFASGDFYSTPNTNVFYVGHWTGTNQSGGTYVAYCFADIAGYSKAFSYTGNGSSDGVFTYLGFSPKFILIKNSGGGATSSLQGWIMLDTSRSTYNVTADALFANNSNASSSNSIYGIDILSNGFKTRGTDGAINESSATYIGIAFASNPFKNSLAR